MGRHLVDSQKIWRALDWSGNGGGT
jgi:hypothetical protein